MYRIVNFTPNEVFDLIAGKEVYDEVLQTGYMSKEKYESGTADSYPVIVLFEKSDLFTLYRENWLEDKNGKILYACCTNDKAKNFVQYLISMV